MFRRHIIDQTKRVIYKKNPLIEVILQVKFPTILSINAKEPAEFQDAIREEYPDYQLAIENEQEINIAIGGDNLLPSIIQRQQHKNHNFISEDKRYKINLTSGFISLSTINYTRWEDMLSHFLTPFNTFLKIYRPPFFERIGLRYIYFDFMSGATFSGIAKEFNGKGVKTPTGKGRWTSNTILSILQNEKYKGDALLQKRFVVDFLEHKTKKNEGEVTQYYVKVSHPAIIPKEDWELIQIEIARRKNLRYNYSKKNPFLGKLICEDCGGYYGRKVWHSNDAKRSPPMQRQVQKEMQDAHFG